MIHREHGSFGADVAGTLMRRHREIFRSRWVDRLASQPASPFELIRAAGRPRLLLLTELVPLNTLSPRMRRVRQLLRALNGPFAVAYLNAASHGVDRYAAVVEELGATPFFPSMNGAPGLVGLDEEELVRINYFPLAVCGSPDAEAFLRGRFPPVLFDATTVIVDVAMEADVAAASLRTAANHFVVMSDAQQQVLLAARPDARCAVLPLDVEATTSQPLSRDGRSDIVILSDNLDGPTAAAAVGRDAPGHRAGAATHAWGRADPFQRRTAGSRADRGDAGRRRPAPDVDADRDRARPRARGRRPAPLVSAGYGEQRR